MKNNKLTIVISHPIQYHAPLYRVIQKSGKINLHVIFLNDKGCRPFFDKLANSYVKYDNDLLSGYSYEFMTEGDTQNWRESWKRFIQIKLADRILASNPDAVYFHGYSNFAFILASKKLIKNRINIFLRGENEDVIKRVWWKTLIREIFIKYIFTKINGFLYIGNENRDFYLKRGIKEEQLHFVPYSADNEYFGINILDENRLKLRTIICDEYGVKKNGVIFINTCKHRNEKRPMDLINSFIKASKNLMLAPDCTLFMVGDGPLNAEMREAVKNAGITNIIWTGFVNQTKMRDLLIASDYCINPGEEPWGCVFNEALPAGLGLISSDRIVGWPDMVKIGKNGFIYRCGCEKSLAAILSQCSKNPYWIKEFRIESKKIASEYSYDKCVSGLISALNSVC